METQSPSPVAAVPGTLALFSREDVAKHAAMDDAWIIIGEDVLDVTAFIRRHPGGDDVIMDFMGRCVLPLVSYFKLIALSFFLVARCGLVNCTAMQLPRSKGWGTRLQRGHGSRILWSGSCYRTARSHGAPVVHF